MCYNFYWLARRRSCRLQSQHSKPAGAYLVLQLHDELIYEVRSEDVQDVANIVKHNMETAMDFSVKLPVKIKVGPTWGKLDDLDL